MAYEDKDPRTIEALEKIKAILREYDLFGACSIVSAERVHWLLHFDSSWSCLSIDEATHRANIRAKAADFVTPEQHALVVELTARAIHGCRELALEQFEIFDQLKALLAGKIKFDFEHSDVELKWNIKHDTSKVDYNSAAFAKGMEDGKSGAVCDHLEFSDAEIHSYTEGWIMGDEERKQK